MTGSGVYKMYIKIQEQTRKRVPLKENMVSEFECGT